MDLKTIRRRLTAAARESNQRAARSKTPYRERHQGRAAGLSLAIRLIEKRLANA